MNSLRVYECNMCKTKDMSKFYLKNPNLCKECKKIAYPKIKLCKKCGEYDPKNFNEGRNSSCKKCQNIKVSEYRDKIKKDETLEEIVVNSDIKNQIRKFFEKDYTVLSGFTFPDKIQKICERIDKLEKYNENLENTILELNTVNNILKNENALGQLEFLKLKNKFEDLEIQFLNLKN